MLPLPWMWRPVTGSLWWLALRRRRLSGAQGRRWGSVLGWEAVQVQALLSGVG